MYKSTASMVIVTTPFPPPGFEVERAVGPCWGITVRSRSVLGTACPRSRSKRNAAVTGRRNRLLPRFRVDKVAELCHVQWMLTPDQYAPETPRRLKRREYDKLVELGFFADERIELLMGVLVQMSRQDRKHTYVINCLTMWLAPALVGRAIVQVQGPFAASEDSEPEPDVVVIAPGADRDDHPSTAFLVIEVSGDSLRKDRHVKSRLYAASGIREYWIVDMTSDSVEIRSEPVGEEYRTLRIVGRDDVLFPRAFPDLSIKVAALLP
jgi:Uma2 family endonuclease